MPTTRKKVIKTVYKDEEDSEQGGDFSDSGSEAVITEQSSSEEEHHSSDDDFITKKPNSKHTVRSINSRVKNTKLPKSFKERFNKQDSDEQAEAPPISVKDLTDADKLLPSFLNLSESDSSDDEQPSTSTKKIAVTKLGINNENYSDNETDTKVEYKDVWSNNAVDESEEIARKTFLELEQHKNKLEETKITVQKYISKCAEKESDVKDLLALGEEEIEPPAKARFKKKRVINNDSESELEDWEEVNENNATIPQQGLQLFVDIPGVIKRKSKKLDVEMMLKRKMNRVKKQYQVYMHKVHVLCWLGHGNYVSQVLNDQEILAAALSLVPSKECYPGHRVDMKYIEQITQWYKDKVNIQQDKNENKYRPKAPPLKDILIQQMKKRVFSTKKYMVFVFVSMLRSLGLQCRVMFNFVTLPIRPLVSELCSLSIKDNDKTVAANETEKIKPSSSKTKAKKVVIPQLDGNYDIFESDNENIMQVDGGDDSLNVKTRRQKQLSLKKENTVEADKTEDSVSPPKRSKRNLSLKKNTEATNPVQKIKETNADKKSDSVKDISTNIDDNKGNNSVASKRTKRNLSVQPKNMEASKSTSTVKEINGNKISESVNDDTNSDNNKEEDSDSPPKRSKRNLLSLQVKNSETSKTQLKEINSDKKLESVKDKTINTIDSKEKDVISPNKSPKRNLSLQNKRPEKLETSKTQLKEINTDKKLQSVKDKTLNTLDSKEKEVISPNKSPKRNLSLRNKRPETSKLTNQKEDITESIANKISGSTNDITANTNKIEGGPKRSKRNLSQTKKTESSKSEESDIKSENKEEIKIEKTQKTLRANNKQEQEDRVKTEKTVNQEERLSKSKTNKCSAGGSQPKLNVQSVQKDGSNTSVSKMISRSIPKVVLTDIDNKVVKSEFFEKPPTKTNRKRSQTIEPKKSLSENKNVTKTRTRSAHNPSESKYFTSESEKIPVKRSRTTKKQDNLEDEKRVSHKDLAKKKAKAKNDVTDDLVHIIKDRVKEAKVDAKKLIVKEKQKNDSDADSDYLAVESPGPQKSETDEDFKPEKITPKNKKNAKKIDRRVISSDTEELSLNKINVWCEIFVEELEEWIAVDIVRGKVHCASDIYSHASHPVSYVVGWDNNNYLKDLTRRYVPYWNTVTRKQRVQPLWWDDALKPWLGTKSARDREEDERLDRMQLEAPLPKIIAEYKNHPLYVLKRHLLKFEVIYPPDAPTLGFVRGEPVYSRECVHICKSRDVWIKEAKVVKLGEEPYKIVKARPKYIRATNTFITDLLLDVFGPWQIQDYEPPVAENGIVPRNAYGNVELFKECMLPKGTVHMTLPNLHRVAKKLNIDCAPALTGFDCHGGWTHPVYDGAVVCQEFEKELTDAWFKDQEDQERKEQDKIESRVYGNWRRLIRGLLIKERLKAKYGFEEPSTSQNKKNKGPKFVVKKK